MKWMMIGAGIGVVALFFYTLTAGLGPTPEKQAKLAKQEAKTELVSNKSEVAKDEWLLRDFKVVDGKAVYDPALNPQGKVASNGSDKNAIPTGSSQEARDKVDDYMRHSASALWATAYPQGLTGSVKNYINEWIDVHDGKARRQKPVRILVRGMVL